MNLETINCQNCKKEFQIESEDLNFYEKIKVPPPTWCPECRLKRRMNWRNERSLYKRKCNAPDHIEELISIFPQNKPWCIYDPKYWWSDKWNPLDYGLKYNFTVSFFSQLSDLLGKTPFISLFETNNVNCSYCNISSEDRECYLSIGSVGNEKAMYINRTAFSKDSLDLYMGNRNELCYETLNCNECYKLIFSADCTQCVESAFLYNCVNCLNCINCANLRNKSYCISNKQYSKEEYFNELTLLNLGSFKSLEKLKNKYKKILLNTLRKFAIIYKSNNTTGNNVQNANNCKSCFGIVGPASAENCKYLSWGGYGTKECYDLGSGFGPSIEFSYECFDAGEKDSNIYFSIGIHGCFNIYYCNQCHGSSNLFGCVGLRSKSYCILNKQYTKEEYEELVPKIIQHMNDMPYVDKKGRIYKYGEFFPPELSPFCYNETIAQEYFPLTKEQALEQGYNWKEREHRNYEIDIKNEDIPDNIKNVKDNIIGKVIECEHKGECNEQCTEAFKIIENELQFYKRMNLPLPHLCPNCRHYQRLKQRNPLKLWHRQCMCNKTNHLHGDEPCEVEFGTSYAPDRPEIIYCEKCYQQEVY